MECLMEAKVRSAPFLLLVATLLLKSPSLGASSRCIRRDIFVRPWREGTALFSPPITASNETSACSVVVTRQGQCEEIRCLSLESALLRAAEYAEPNFLIRLDAEPSSNCAVLLRDRQCGEDSRGLTISPPDLANGSRLFVELNHQSECPYAILRSMPCLNNKRETLSPSSSSAAIISIVNASQLVFRRIRFDLGHFRHLKGLLDIRHSNMVMFEECTFLVALRNSSAGKSRACSEEQNGPGATYGVDVLNSMYVLFTGCKFHGHARGVRIKSIIEVLRCRRPRKDFKRGLERSALRITHSPPASACREMTEEGELREWFHARAQCRSQTYRHDSLLSHPGLPTAVAYVHNCTFSHIGRPFEYRSEDKRMIRANKVLGYALHVQLNSSCGGRVVVNDSTFCSNNAPYGTVAKVEVNLGNTSNGSGVEPGNATNGSGVEFENCRFRNNSALIGGGATIVYCTTACTRHGGGHDNTPADGQVSVQHRTLFSNCQFDKNQAEHQGGAVYVFFDVPPREHVRTRTLFEDCQFLRNRVNDSRGAGGAVYSRSMVAECSDDTWMAARSSQPNVAFERCDFIDNDVDLGTIFLRSVNAEITNGTFKRNENTAVVLNCARATFQGRTVFDDNAGLDGGVLRTMRQGVCDLRKVNPLVLVGNTACNQGHFFYSDHYSSSVWLYYTLNYEGNDRPARSRNPPCPLLMPTYLLYDRVALTDVLARNVHMRNLSLDPTTVPIFMASLVYCFKEFSALLDVRPINNLFCMPYAPREVTYHVSEDDQLPTPCHSSHRNITDILDVYASNRSCRENCHGRNPTHPGHSNTPMTTSPEQLGPGLECNRSNSYLHQPPPCFSSAHCLLVRQPDVHSTLTNKSRPKLGSFPTWLFFNNASTSCYKTVQNSRVLYFRGDCKRETIVQYLRSRPDYIPLETDCGLMSLAEEHRIYWHSLVPIVPGYSLALTPWASAIRNWSAPMWTNRAAPTYCMADARMKFPNATRSISDLALNPAPGEVFSIVIDPLDELLNLRPTLLELTIKSESALLGTGTGLVPVKSKSFYSDRGIKSLKLYGRPGSTGDLLFTVKGDLNVHPSRGGCLDLSIPFRLRECHMGFDIAKNVSEREVKGMVEAFCNDRGMPHYSPEEVENKLSCKPKTAEFKECVQEGIDGRALKVHARCWAGGVTTPEFEFKGDPVTDFSFQEFHDNFSRDPFGKMNQASGFAAVQCTTSRCSHHSGNTTWVFKYDGDEVCDNKCNCMGPLCSVCKPGYTWAFFGERCKRCSARTKVPLWSFILLILLVTLCIVLILLVINFGMSSALDSWLFFTHGYFILYGETIFQDGTSFLSTLAVFGLDRMLCPQPITRMLAASGEMILAVALFVPVVLILTVTTYSSRASQLMQRFQRRKSIRHVFWLLTIVSISLVVNSQVKVWKMVWLGTRRVPVADGSIVYFGTEHAVYALVAAALLLLVVVGPLLLLVVQPMRCWPSLIGFVDEATHFYRPRRWWWCCVNILRRVLLSVLDILVSANTDRLVAVLVVCHLVLLLHILTRPLKHTVRVWNIKDFDNRLESTLLVVLCLLGGLSIWKIDDQSARKIKTTVPIVTFSVVTAICLIVHFAGFLKSWWDTLQQKPRVDLRTLWRHSTHRQTRADCQQKVSGLKTALQNDQSLSMDGGEDQAMCGLREPLLLDSLVRAASDENGDWQQQSNAL